MTSHPGSGSALQLKRFVVKFSGQTIKCLDKKEYPHSASEVVLSLTLKTGGKKNGQGPRIPDSVFWKTMAFQNECGSSLNGKAWLPE